MADAVLDEDGHVEVEDTGLESRDPGRIRDGWQLRPASISNLLDSAHPPKATGDGSWSSQATADCLWTLPYGCVDRQVGEDCDRVNPRPARVVIPDKQPHVRDQQPVITRTLSQKWKSQATAECLCAYSVQDGLMYPVIHIASWRSIKILSWARENICPGSPGCCTGSTEVEH